MIFTLIRHLQFRLTKVGEAISVNQIVEAVRNVQASILRDIVDDKQYRLLSALSENAKIIYRVLGIKQNLTAIHLE